MINRPASLAGEVRSPMRCSALRLMRTRYAKSTGRIRTAQRSHCTCRAVSTCLVVGVSCRGVVAGLCALPWSIKPSSACPLMITAAAIAVPAHCNSRIAHQPGISGACAIILQCTAVHDSHSYRGPLRPAGSTIWLPGPGILNVCQKPVALLLEFRIRQWPLL